MIVSWCVECTKVVAEIISCLNWYSPASDQINSPLKSYMIFGAKVHETIKEEVKLVWGRNTEGRDNFYLLLPKWFTGSKRKLLTFFVNIFEKDFKDCSLGIYLRGKNIFMKLVGLALLIFPMPYFKLPKDVILKVNKRKGWVLVE